MGTGTGIGRVRGLGSAKSGAHHWWLQRVTAAGNLLLVTWFFVSLVRLPSFDYLVVTDWMRSPVTAVGLILTMGGVRAYQADDPPGRELTRIVEHPAVRGSPHGRRVLPVEGRPRFLGGSRSAASMSASVTERFSALPLLRLRFFGAGDSELTRDTGGVGSSPPRSRSSLLALR